jgi:hypothetical protein
VAKNNQAELEVDRRNRSDRRKKEERRKQSIPVAAERRGQGERRVKVQRRRQIDPTTCEREYTDAEVEFMHALDDYKRASGRMFPTCSEILEVIRNLGYVQVSPPTVGVCATPAPQFEAAIQPEDSDEF